MSYHVLIVEDYDDAREYLTIILQAFGFQVHEATNGSEALVAVNEYQPDLILMDLSMPVMDGLEATRAIRQLDSKISETPIIAVTAFDKNYYKNAVEAGCNDVTAKPVNFETLQLIIEKYLP